MKVPHGLHLLKNRLKHQLVKAGRLTIDEVPIKFRERVQERLSELKET